MRVAMLSPGPSLVKYPGRNGYDLVIGVNRVPFKHECDWWSLADDTAYLQRDKGDPLTWGRHERIGSPRLFVKRATISKLSWHKEQCDLRDAIAPMPDKDAVAFLAKRFEHPIQAENLQRIRSHVGTPEDWEHWKADEPRVKYHDECLLPRMPDTGIHHPCGTTRWDKFGGPTALCLCWLLGGKEVDVYGADMGGFLDADGFDNRTRHDGRWKLERTIWTLLVEGFTNAGLTIRRIL